jgi:hypothetical protein
MESVNDLTGWELNPDNKSEIRPANGVNSIYNSTKGCIEIPLSTNLLSFMRSNGIGFNFGNNLVITNLTIE